MLASGLVQGLPERRDLVPMRPRQRVVLLLQAQLVKQQLQKKKPSLM